MLKIIKKNDTKDVINYQLLDDDGSPVNLAGATVNFVMGKKNKLITNSPAIITAANDGIVEYPLTITDTLVSGTFLAEFVVTFSNGEQKTFPNNGYITVNVEQNLDTNQTNVVVDMLAAKQGDFETKLNSILQLNNINVSAMGEYTWTATEGQLIYTLPSTVNYTVDSKWFQVYVGNIPIDPSLVNRLNNTQFSFIVESSYIKAGMKISARWTEPVVPLNIGSELTAMNEWTWTATNGQLVYTFPENANYKLSSKWFQVYVDNVLVDASLVQRLTDTQFSLNITPSYIEAGMHVKAQWTESVVPFTGGHRSTHELGGQDPIDITELTGYQENIAMPLADMANQMVFVTDKRFGVVGDGTDETVKIQAASDYCATNKKVLVFPYGTYGITTLLPKDGIVGYWSFGATLKALAKVGEGMIACNLSTQVNNYFVRGFTFDCNGLAKRAVFVYGSKTKIINNEIFGLTSPTNSSEAIRFYWDSNYNLVADNHITLGIDSPLGTYPSLNGIIITGKYSTSYAGLGTSDDIVPGTNPSSYNTVRNNYIFGGTHGISLMGSEHNKIYDNTLEKQSHRNIILSPLASHNSIHNNDCINFGSTGVHMAYGSSNNKVSDNKIYADGSFMISGSGGEGAIQAYVHCRDNQIVNNKIYTRSTRQGIYVAIYCGGTVIEGNEVDGGMRGGITVESDWEVATAVYGVYSLNPPINPNWTSWANGKKSEYITIRNNTIYRNQAGVVNSGIYIGQSLTAEFNYLTIENNIIYSANTSGHDFYVYVNDDTKFNNNSIKNNGITPLSDMSAIFFSNKNIKLLAYKNNNWQDRLTTISTATDTLDISVSNNISLGVAMTITTINGAMLDGNMLSGRTFVIKLYPGAVITHNNAKIRLKGDANITATSTNQMVMLQNFSGILFEVGRNF